MKLGLFKYHADKVRKKRKLTFLDFVIALYISECDSVTKYDVKKYVTSSNGTVATSLAYLVDQGIVKIVQRHRGRAGISQKYAIGVKGRHMITEFQMLMTSPVF
jgi:DNA-binding PadR family transcriptional regulator